MTTNKMGDAEAMARVTGSVGATVINEHITASGDRVIDSISVYGKVAATCPRCEGLMVTVRGLWRCTGCGMSVRDADAS